MGPMRLFICLLAAVGTCSAAAANLSAILDLPDCGQKCLFEWIPKSACKSLTDFDCICRDADLTSKVEECLLSRCKPIEAIEVARVQADICELPVRNRKMDFQAMLSIEIFAGVCLLLRLYSRWVTVRKFELDDYVMMVVLVLYTVFLALGQAATSAAFGVDIWTLSNSTITNALKIFYVDEAFYLAILPLTKISILCFYFRIFPQHTFRIICLVVVGFVALSGLTLIFLQIFQCVPVSYNWEGWTEGTKATSPKCLDVNVLTYTAAAVSIVQDIIILFLPLPLLIELSASWREKSAISLMFSLGTFVLVTSCVRLRYLVQFARSTNPTWDYTDTVIWTALEAAVSIIVTSLPALRVLLGRVLPEVFGTVVGSRLSRHSAGRSGAGSSKLFGSDSSSRNTGAGFHGGHIKLDDGPRAAETEPPSLSGRSSPGLQDLEMGNVAGAHESRTQLGDEAWEGVETEIARDYGPDDGRSTASSLERMGGFGPVDEETRGEMTTATVVDGLHPDDIGLAR